jgi:hypothetical protein
MMKGEIMKRIILLLLLVILVGCAPKRNVTPQEFLSMTNHAFPNTTVEKVLLAVESVARSIDPNCNVLRRENGIKALREISIIRIKVDYNLTATQINNDVSAKLEIIGNRGSLERKEYYDWHEAYDLFFNRMESILYGKEWIVCKEAESKVENSITLETICFKAKDDVPQGVKLSPASQKIVNKR